jgi:hypothetical protein
VPGHGVATRATLRAFLLQPFGSRIGRDLGVGLRFDDDAATVALLKALRRPLHAQVRHHADGLQQARGWLPTEHCGFVARPLWPMVRRGRQVQGPLIWESPELTADAPEPEPEPEPDILHDLDDCLAAVEQGSPDHAMLGVLPSARPCVLKAAYRALAQESHPDRHGDQDALVRLNAAWEALREPP